MASRGIIGAASPLWRSLLSIFRLPAFPAKGAKADDPRHCLGSRGEQLAARWLARNGYKILYCNYRARGGGEVDIVCRDRKTGEIVFIEVKTRSAEEDIRPSDAVELEKQRLIARGALSWLRALGNPDVAGRFDVVEVILPEGEAHWRDARIEVIRDAFPLPTPWHY